MLKFYISSETIKGDQLHYVFKRNLTFLKEVGMVRKSMIVEMYVVIYAINN
jgi:hypothetical protein